MESETKKKEIVKLEVLWDEEKQAVTALNFKPEELRSWFMVEAILQLAYDDAHFRSNVARASGMQQQQMAAMQEQAIRQNIKIGRA